MRGSTVSCVVLASLVVHVVSACEPPPPPPPSALRSEDVGTPVRATLGAAGGVLQTTQGGVTYVLRVPAGALAVDTELVLTPARLTGVDGSVGARFEPDGLTFLAPATMVVSPSPPGDVLVALQDGSIPVAAELAVPLPDGALIAVEHFSTHAVANAAAAQSALPADVLAAVRGLTGLSRSEVTAIAIGIFYATHVEPLLPLSARDVHGFEIASGAALPWVAVATGAPDDVRELPHQRGGSESVETLADRVVADLVAAGQELYRRLTPPLCSGTPDIGGVLDWALLSANVQGHLAAFGESVEPLNCLTSRITVTGPTTMTSTTRDLNVRLRFDVQGPAADPRSVPSDASFTIDAVGATGPTEIQDGNGGDVRSVEYVREPGPDRARVVTLTVDALSSDAQLGSIPTPASAVFTVVEEGTGITLTATPEVLQSPSETSRICVAATRDGEAVQDFTARFTRQGPGSLDVDIVATLDGLACTNYLPPSPLPAGGGQAVINARVTLSGGALEGQVVITLGTSALDLDLVATPQDADEGGETLAVCARLTSDGTPVNVFEVQFALTGPGTLGELAVISVNTDDGRVCVDWTAPASLVVGQSATVTARATVDALSANGSVVIPFVERAAPLTSIFEGRWVGTASYAWSATTDNSSLNDSAIINQSGSGTFDLSCTLSPPPNAFLDRISTCTISNHVGTASFTNTRRQGPLLCEVVTNQNSTCAAETSCPDTHDCMTDPANGNGRCALCLGTGFHDQLTTHAGDFDLAAAAPVDSFFQVLAEDGATRVFWQNPRVGILGHFTSTLTCAVEGPDCSGSTSEPLEEFETDLSALQLPSVVFDTAFGETPVNLVPGGTIAGSMDMDIGTASFTLEHVR